MKIEKGLTTLFLSHQNADPDAVGCLYFLTQRYGGTAGLPTQPDRMGKKLLDHLDMEVMIEPEVSGYEQIVIVDTPNPSQLEPIEFEEEDMERAKIIDHHHTNSWDRDIFFKNKNSCAEIIFDMVEPEGLEKDETIALIAGILTDTSFLRRGDADTFRILSEIMRSSQVSINEVSQILSHEVPYSEKISRFKAASRLDYKKVNGYFVAYTNVSSFESSVSSMLLMMGADVAFTMSKRGKDIRISARAVDEMVDEGFDLGELFKSIANSKENFSGGGHEGAAVLNGTDGNEKLIRECVGLTVEWIKDQGLERPLE